MARLAESLIAIITIASMAVVFIIHSQVNDKKKPEHKSAAIPRSVAQRSEMLLSALEEAQEVGGETGKIAEQVRRLLTSHAAREQSLALPPLGALRPLSLGDLPPDADHVLRLSSELEKELPLMIEEHHRIKEALVRLQAIARDEHRDHVAGLATALMEFVNDEEDVLYPAAILVGDYLRMRGDA